MGSESMERELKEAACSGDVEFLIKALAEKPADYFVTAGNIFYYAACNEQVELMRVAMERLLPIQVHRLLLSGKDGDDSRSNPLHILAAKNSNKSIEMVRLILGFYKSSSANSDDALSKPWLARDRRKRTPFHVALDEKNEECALELLSMDTDLFCGMADDGYHGGPLFLAIDNKLSRVAEKILTSDSSSISLTGTYGLTVLHIAPNCSEKVGRLLLEKHAGLLDSTTESGETVLDRWAELGLVWPLNLIQESGYAAIRNKVFRDLINRTDRFGYTPLNSAVSYRKTEFARALVDGYLKEIRGNEITEPLDDYTPLKMKDRYGNTPLNLAIDYRLEDFALYLLSVVPPQLYQIRNDLGESPLFLAVKKGCQQVIEEILRSHPHHHFDTLRNNDEQTVFHALSYYCSDDLCGSNFEEKILGIGRVLIRKFWWVLNLRDKEGKTAMETAQELDAVSIVQMLRDPSIPRSPFNWIATCETGDSQALHTFTEQCQDFQRLCLQEKDTPLHHIKLQTYQAYKDFLRIPLIAELKNTLDSEGATPLHRALERKDMHLVKALLTEDGVDRTIKNRNGKTAIVLLAKLCDENAEWLKMCKDIHVYAYLKTSYIRSGTNLDQMRNTLTVVAALLATITFAAGFTLPGGVDDKTGYAISAKKAAFIVFLLADVYAMCTSMLVLFCLIWSMVSDPDMSQLLVDRSVLILMQSLYGTLLAFTTGIYTVVSHKSLWATILIIVMCSLIAISANRTVLHYVLAKFIPAASTEQKDRLRLLEEGNASTSGKDTSRKAE